VIYTYNSLGKPETITAAGATTYIKYDDRGFQRALKDVNMTDSIKYVYDAYGQLTSQTNARGQTTSFQYDAAGRVTQESCPERTLTYQYVPSGNGIGQIQTIKQSNAIVRSYDYTPLGQLSSLTEKIDNVDYTTSYSYNALGQMQEKQSPSGLRINYQYNNNGLLTSMRNAENNNPLWQLDAANALGQITESTLGNGLKRISGYDAYYSPNQILLKNGNSIIDQVDYNFNSTTGNLTSRNDISNGKNEIFGYDKLNRLTSQTLNGGSANSIAYYPNGNINAKFDVGTYQYNNGNHAVSGITNQASSYNPSALSIANTSYNRILCLTQQGSIFKELCFQYNPDNLRNKTTYAENDVLKKTMYYAGNYEKEVIPNVSTKEYDYICTPEGISAIAVKTNGTRSFYYVQTDHLGSIRVITTDTDEKAIQTRYYYDAWGRQTLVSGTSITNRGYIGEEHLNEFGLLNLNARIYDPALGRFLEMDPYVQNPDFTQSHNRYSYGMNNPLIFTDPDGELAWFVVPIICAVIFAAGNTATHAINGDINNFGDGLKYFAQGAVTGFALGCVWQFAPYIPYIGQGIHTVMTWYAIGQGVVGGLGMIGGANADKEGGLGRAAKLFLGNFYLENNWIGGVWQGFSRHTWEMLQTFVGQAYSQGRNLSSDVDRVDYFDGATFATNENAGSDWGVTIGNYININNSGTITGNFDDYVITHPMYMHEYGHTIDGRAWGPLYLFGVGLPSLISASSKEMSAAYPYLYKHDVRPYEKMANTKAERYFRNHYGVDWDALDPEGHWEWRNGVKYYFTIRDLYPTK